MIFFKRITFLFLFFLQTLCLAQPYTGTEKVIVKQQTSISKAASCTPPTTSTYLELNNVRAMIHTAGNLWHVPNQNFSQYEVPKHSGIMALFTAALWLGGTDVNGQLKIAALRYRNGQDYWTGPLSKNTATTDYDNCHKYDKHFTSTYDEVSQFNAWFEAGQNDQLNGTSTQDESFPHYIVPDIVKKWPAHGDVSLGQDYYLAPFFDRNEDGEYRWEDGDYPWYDLQKNKDCKSDRNISLYGDLNLWWVMNDKGNIHTETQGEPIGMEIRAQAFSFSSNDEINNMTFYNYELINRGTQTLYNTYFGFFTDGALGDPFDDFVGCDVNRGLAYYYNGNNYDADNAGFKGYGNNPPAVGVDFFEGPFQDNDGIDNSFGIGPNEALNGIGYGDGVIDNERFGMRRFLYYSNNTNGANPNQTDPIQATDYYNYLQGKWKDGTEFYYGGNGYISDPDADPTVPCDFMFPGDTDPLGWGTNGVPQAPWTEQSAGNVPNDRRFVQSAGPFVLTPGSVNNITVGICWARGSAIDPFESVKVLLRADDKAQALFENCFRVLEGPHAPDLTIQELENELILMLTNPITSNNYTENYEEIDPLIVAEDPSADKKYKFQGYQIYQLKKEDIAINDLSNPEKARLVAQCDLKDGYARIINFEFDEDLKAPIPVEKVNGSNSGIKHSFSVKQDLFALGSSKLVNFKQYYYMAVSYATNNYKTYNPTDPMALDGQQKIYLMSRKGAFGSVNSVKGVPHHPMPEAGGTIQLQQFGSTPEITRLDGYGNGNRALELTPESEEFIVQNGKMDNPTYRSGSGPIHVKVVDPLNLADGYFECLFDHKGYNGNGTNGADSAKWTIHRYDFENGTLLDSKTATMSIAQDNEQIIPQWGISVQIHQVKYHSTDPNSSPALEFTTPISATISYQDSSLQWLSNIMDGDGFTPNNWIRSGSSKDTSSVGNPPYLAPKCYKDELNVDPEKWYASDVNKGFAPHRLVGYQCDFQPLAYCGLVGNTPPGAMKGNARISYTPSIDLVICSDRSKWTRCPVFELGRDPNLTIGMAKAGELRKSPSVNKEGKNDGSGTTGMGWFPGYAIDLESGARLFMAFGENSFLGTDNGGDMLWNPSDRVMDNQGNPIFGGQHPIYIYSYQQATINGNNNVYDFPAYDEYSNEVFALMQLAEAGNMTAKRRLYGSMTWVGNLLLNKAHSLLATDVKIKLRVNKEYKNYIATNRNEGRPMYSWNMDKFKTEKGKSSALSEALKMINVVPNPYYAYSEYERNRLDTQIKITNLPEKCTVTIYSVSGKLVRTFQKDSPETWVNWDLNNHKSIPVAGGVYLIHVEVPGIGERVLKFFGGMRQVDLHGT
jgi:hypothetical protein